MKCRINVKGQKIWVDDNNAHNTRPESVEIFLTQDGVEIDAITLDSSTSGRFVFPCLIRYKNGTQYYYAVDERAVPDGYYKRIEGNNIINTLINVGIDGVVTWLDNYDEWGYRPSSTTLRLMQNGVQIDLIEVDSPPVGEITSTFSFGTRAFADAQGVPYLYTIAQDSIANYVATYSGFNVTNTLDLPSYLLSFNVVRADGLPLPNATFELSKNNGVVAIATSDENGLVELSFKGDGEFELRQSVTPAGFIENVNIYDVEVSSSGEISIDGLPMSEFEVENQPLPYGFTTSRLAGNAPLYSSVPVAWPLHGGTGDDLYMMDKIMLDCDTTPAMVKWAEGVHLEQFFRDGGGTDVTSTYTNGIAITQNASYTVYAMFANGHDTISSININNLRDGSVNYPYLLLDYSTAEQLGEWISGAEVFVLGYMCLENMLDKNFELYEDVDMIDRIWTPIGTTTTTPPYSVVNGFSGTFEGNNHAIFNYELLSMSSEAQAFFKAVDSGATIQNLTINGVVSGYWTAGFVGSLRVNTSDVTLNNLTFNGSLTNLNTTIDTSSGGIVADASVTTNNLNITNCTFNGNYSGGIIGGGIIGRANIENNGTLSVQGCNTSGTCSQQADSIFGGIVGKITSPNSTALVTLCVNQLACNSLANASGIVCEAGADSNGTVTISSCINRGNINANAIASGIFGTKTTDFNQNVGINNCYNTASITSTTQGAGGISANETDTPCNVNNCYNVGEIVGNASPTGGICANTDNVNSCASIGATAQVSTSVLARIKTSTTAGSLVNNVAFGGMVVMVGGVAKTLVEGLNAEDGQPVVTTSITSQTLYSDTLAWDFDAIWVFGNGDYALPILNGIPTNLQPTDLPGHLI